MKEFIKCSGLSEYQELVSLISLFLSKITLLGHIFLFSCPAFYLTLYMGIRKINKPLA